jgi:hypothetical protein
MDRFIDSEMILIFIRTGFRVTEREFSKSILLWAFIIPYPFKFTFPLSRKAIHLEPSHFNSKICFCESKGVDDFASIGLIIILFNTDILDS